MTQYTKATVEGEVLMTPKEAADWQAFLEAQNQKVQAEQLKIGAPKMPSSTL
jgi:hypothetical protein